MAHIAFETRFALGALATWRLAHLVAEEDGPADVVVRLRRRAGDGDLGAAMDCLYCLSIWIALPLAAMVAPSRRDGVLTWLALAGAACVLERATAPGRPGVAGGAPGIIRPLAAGGGR
jgi:hypothetical protein